MLAVVNRFTSDDVLMTQDVPIILEERFLIVHFVRDNILICECHVPI